MWRRTITLISAIVPVPSIADQEAGPAPARLTEDATSRAIRAVQRAIAVYDYRLRSAHWRQTLYSPPTATRGWLASERSELAFDEHCQWFVSSERPWVDEEDGTSGVMRGTFISNGRAMLATSPDDDAGRLTSPEPSHYRFLTTPWGAIGRLLDQESGRELHEIAESMTEAQFVSAGPGQAEIGVIGVVTLNGVPALLRLMLDPNHDLAPCEITYWLADRNQPVERTRVVEFEMQSGAWLPKRIMRAAYNAYRREDQDERIQLIENARRRLEAADVLAGFPGGPVTDALASAWRQCLEVGKCGSNNEFIYAPLGMSEHNGPYVPEIAVVEWISVNQPIPSDKRLTQTPGGSRVFDGFSGRWLRSDKPAALPEIIP